MKHLAIILLVLVPLALMSIEFRDYTNPTSFGKEAFLNGYMNFKDGNQDQSSYDGSFGGNYLLYYYSQPFNWRVNGDGSLLFNRGPMDGQDTETGYQLTTNAMIDKYLNDTDFFGYAALNLGYRKQLLMDDADDPYVKIGVGAGYGRLIDATVLSKAMRVVEELIKYKVINGEPSKAGYIELAQIIEKRNEFITTWGAIEYKKYWFEAMEDVFNKEGVLRDGSLHAIGVVRLQEVLDERFSIRKYGWNVRAGLGYILSNYDGSDSDPTIDASFEYANPLSRRLQFIEKLDYSTILSDDLNHWITNTASLSYEISSMVDWENKLITSFWIPGDSNLETTTTIALESAFYYYLTNKLNFNASLKFQLYDDGIEDNGNDDMETTFYMGVSYRLK